MSSIVKERQSVSFGEHAQEIHSGHFMVSNLDDSELEAEDTDTYSREDSLDTPQQSGIMHNSTTVVTTNVKGNTSSAAFEELESLFKYLKIAYTGKLTSPKWNQFRGLRFALKSKIRLNNIIWREYHSQFVKNAKPYVVHFQAPLTENHNKPEAVVMEGKYWKRSNKTLSKEYGLLRKFAKDRIVNPHNRRTENRVGEILGPPSLYSFPKSMNDLQASGLPSDAVDEDTFGLYVDDIMMDFDQNLEDFVGTSFPFPDPKDLAVLGIGDIMQPGLLQFQPDTQDEPMTDLQALSCGFTSSSCPVKRSPTAEYVAGSVLQCKPNEVPTETTNCPLHSMPSYVFVPGSDQNVVVSTTPAEPAEAYGYLDDTCFQPLPIDPSSFPTGLKVDVPSIASASFPREIVKANDYVVAPNRRERDHIAARSTAKHGYQQPSYAARRLSTVKRSRIVQPNRHRGSSSMTANHPSDRALKTIIRSNYFDASRSADRNRDDVGSDTPALINVLTHDTESQTASNRRLPHAFSNRQLPDTTNDSGCSAPLLCSALTTPLFSQSSYPRPVLPNQQFGSAVKHRRPQQSVSEPVRFLLSNGLSPSSSASLVTDSTEPGRGSDCVEACRYAFMQSSLEAPSSKRPAPEIKENYPASILKSTLTASHRGSVPNTTANFPNAQNTLFNHDPHIITNQGAFLTTQHSNTSDPDLHTGSMKAHSFLNQMNENQRKSAIPAEDLPPLDGSPVVLRRFTETHLSLGTPPSPASVNKAASFDVFHNISPAPQLPAVFAQPSHVSRLPHDKPARQRTNSGNNLVHLSDVAQVIRWPGDVTCAGERMPNWSSLSVRGRSSSAGNLFPLPQQILSNVTKLDSATTVSSCGSTELLSPPMSSQPTFIYPNSPSCSPPPLTHPDTDLSGRFPASSSSEERRRHSMQSSLKTLRQLIQLYSGHTTCSNRKHPEDYDCSPHSDVFLRNSDEVTDEHNPQASIRLDGKQEESPFWLPAHESKPIVSAAGSGRASNAATLRESAELIRRLRDANNTWETKRKALLDEIAVLGTQTAPVSEERVKPIHVLQQAFGGQPAIEPPKPLKTKEDLLWSTGECGRPTGLTPQRWSSLTISRLLASLQCLALNRQIMEPQLTNQSKKWFRQYVQQQTEKCWKFYLFSLLIEKLFTSYCTVVNTTSKEQFVRSLGSWLDQYCSFAQLRPALTQALCKLATCTAVLQEPGQLPEQARRMAAEQSLVPDTADRSSAIVDEPEC
ncbi:hypothetical protein PHET_04362 [Paragonimus heterotremus]|uniref:MLX-interacting protein n=1 Tax=Paragonimus heterotremus TaxID=100268 RepID=A0A8J4X0N5_9TREM|nr:hypothetical protein PHET_04362 [Paragonimus heterotremus]